MYEPIYILTTVIPKGGEFEACFKDIKSGQLKVKRKELKSQQRYKNIPLFLQFFIENDTHPLSVYDGMLYPIGMMSFKSFKQALQQRCTTIDIEVLNPNRIPNPNHDEIVCISYGNGNWVDVKFNGKGENKIGENYAIHFDNEENILKETLKDLSQSSDLFLCGYNTFSFDLRYIKTRAELLGIPNEIKVQTAKTLFENRKICILPNFMNIDILPLIQYANLPSTKLEHVSKIFGLEPSKMPIEELWLYYDSKKFDRIIEHNVNDVIITSEVLNQISFPIYLLVEKTIGTFTYGLYSNLPRNIMVRTLLNHYKKKGYKIEEILETIDKELVKISFSFGKGKVKGKLEVKVDARLEKAKLLDLALMASEKLKNYNLVFEDLLRTYQEIASNSIEEKVCKRMISGILYKILMSMGKTREYKNKIESVNEKIKNEVRKNSRIYCSSGKYLVVDDFQDHSFSLTDVILHSEPRIFLANCEGILIGTIPRNPVGTPVKFYEAFIQDLFNIALGKPAEEMKKMRKKLEEGNLSMDDLKIEVRGVDTTQLTKDTKKKNFADRTLGRKTELWERIYVVKTKEGFSTLEEMRRNPERIQEADLDFYRREFYELWGIFKTLNPENSLDRFFG